MKFPHFTDPSYLYYGLPVVVVSVTALWYLSKRARASMRKRYGEGHLVDTYSPPESWFRQIFSLTAWLIATSSLVFAAAGPYLSDSLEQVKAGSTQVMNVLDVSVSMAAEDYRKLMPEQKAGEKTEAVGPYGSRLDVAKLLISQILRTVQGNQVGLITYAGRGFPQADLTTDYLALDFVLKNWVIIGNAPGAGSNFGEGLLEAVEAFKRDFDPNKKRIIVLLSDGGLTGDKAKLDEAIAQIRDLDIAVVVVGIGLYEPVAIPIYDENDEFAGYFGQQDQPVMTAFEEAALKDLAAQTNGKYIHLDSAYEKLEIPWVDAFGGNKVEPHARHIFPWFVATSMFALFGIALSQFFRKTKTFSQSNQDALSSKNSFASSTERT